MHEMQTIVIDDRGVCLSVCLSVTRLKSASLRKTSEQIQILFGVNSLGGLRNIVLNGAPDPHSEEKGSRGKFGPLWTPTYLQNGSSYRLEISCAFRGWGP